MIKQAICKAHEYDVTSRSRRIAALYKAVFGVVFIGTPHRGSYQTSWASIATNLAKVIAKDHNSQIVEALSHGSEVLEGLQDTFAGIVDRLAICSALEEHEVSMIGKIVDGASATLGLKNETLLWIPADHMDMCKFSASDEIGYKRLRDHPRLG